MGRPRHDASCPPRRWDSAVRPFPQPERSASRCNTGYGIVYLEIGFADEWDLTTQAGTVEFPDGAGAEFSDVIEEAEYGRPLGAFAYAVDEDEWCLYGAEAHLSAPEVQIDIEFHDGHFLGYLYELDPPTCGGYGVD